MYKKIIYSLTKNGKLLSVYDDVEVIDAKVISCKSDILTDKPGLEKTLEFKSVIEEKTGTKVWFITLLYTSYA